MKNGAARAREFRRSLEMTISREEFLRLLRGAVGPFVLVGQASVLAPQESILVGQAPTLAWTIRLVPLPDRRLGGLTIPRHRVEISLGDCTEAEGERFLERFHRRFLRGGG
jgi:hypothetical protein